MVKAEVLKVINKTILENIDDVTEDMIDPNRSLKEYGANSLDIIEIVSCSMRELNIKIPRSELVNIENISQLADKFVEYSNKMNQ